jgi:hypothetical protein
MIPARETLLPPRLTPLAPLLEAVPSKLHPWIAQKHVQYLDDRIHKIGRLTDYLANCHQVDQERADFIEFVLAWTRRPNPDLVEYLQQYRLSFGSVRARVEELCDSFMAQATSVRLDAPFVDLWRRFAAANELDSIHGMFLTSGRWYVNVMLPVAKELIFCYLAGKSDIAPSERNDAAYTVARRVITPRFAEIPETYDHTHERRFATLFMPVLQHFDRKLCFLFEVFAHFPELSFPSVDEFAAAVAADAGKYRVFLDQGVYPPFAWHELHASRKPRKPSKPLAEAALPMLSAIPADFQTRANTALECLSILKEYELNYNNYNYKGRFGLISKYQYWLTVQVLPDAQKEAFLEAILLDRFFDALAIIEETAAR